MMVVVAWLTTVSSVPSLGSSATPSVRMGSAAPMSSKECLTRIGSVAEEEQVLKKATTCTESSSGARSASGRAAVPQLVRDWKGGGGERANREDRLNVSRAS